MKPHPRIRKTIKWGGAALTVLLVVVWVGSGWNSTGWISPTGHAIYAEEGVVGVGYSPWFYGKLMNAGWYRIPHRFRLVWWWTPVPTTSGDWFIGLATWPLVAVSLATTALAFRLDSLARRRAYMNLCKNCHYNRTGLASDAVCPECGTPASSPQRGAGL